MQTDASILVDWVNGQLFKSRAVISRDWYIDHGEGRYRSITIATQLDMPDAQFLPRFIASLEKTIRILTREDCDMDASISDFGSGKSYSLRAWNDEVERAIKNTSPIFMALQGGALKHGSFYFNWVEETDMRKAVPFETLRYLLFPGNNESVITQQLKQYQQQPYNFRIPSPVDPLENPEHSPNYETEIFYPSFKASTIPFSKAYRSIFMDAANTHLELIEDYVCCASICFWIVERLRRAAEKAQDSNKFRVNSEVNLPALR